MTSQQGSRFTRLSDAGSLRDPESGPLQPFQPAAGPGIPLEDLLVTVYERLADAIAGGQRVNPAGVNPNGGLLDDPFEGLFLDEYRQDAPEQYEWFDPAAFVRASMSDSPAQAIDIAGLNLSSAGPGRAGKGGDWFRGGEAPSNYANRSNPLYVARKDFSVALDSQIQQIFDVTGSAGYYRPPHPSHAAPGGPSANSDHYSAGAVDYFGSTAELQRLRDWLVTQPFTSFVRWQSESHYDHVHVSYDLGWVAENYFGSDSVPDFTKPRVDTGPQATHTQRREATPESMPETVEGNEIPTRRAGDAGIRVL